MRRFSYSASITVLSLFVSAAAWAMPPDAVGIRVCEIEATESTEQILARYDTMLSQLALPSKNVKEARSKARYLSVELAARVRVLPTSKLYARASSYIEMRMRTKGYLPGLTPDSPLTSLEKLLLERKAHLSLRGSAIDNILRNMQSVEMTLNYILMPDVDDSEILEAYGDWADLVEPTEIFKEVIRRNELTFKLKLK